jgi:hypothetical protein
MKLPIKEILNRPELERLKDWASIGPVQKAALEEFADLIVLTYSEIIAGYSDEERTIQSGPKVKQP